MSDVEIGCLVANRNESDDDVECSDDENEMFMYETGDYDTFDRSWNTEMYKLWVVILQSKSLLIVDQILDVYSIKFPFESNNLSRTSSSILKTSSCGIVGLGSIRDV